MALMSTLLFCASFGFLFAFPGRIDRRYPRRSRWLVYGGFSALFVASVALDVADTVWGDPDVVVTRVGLLGLLGGGAGGYVLGRVLRSFLDLPQD